MNTFIFKNQYAACDNIKGFAVYNLNDEEIGVVWRHNHKKGELAQGQAEIRFYDGAVPRYGMWRRIFINKARLSFDSLSDMLTREGSVMLTIDPRRENKRRE
ncbi:MAG: hypothetical protein J6B09_05905 [Clostridia bacterium]|nr:hypothetical protein [Clostridia bacterium]MBQ8717195.1 hypothetical protein [Clostridia bacterium]